MIRLILGIVLLLGTFVVNSYRECRFDVNVAQNMKIATTAYTNGEAVDALGAAVYYLETTGRTSGNTAYIDATGGAVQEVAPWYRNLATLRSDLAKLPRDGQKSKDINRSLMKPGDQGKEVPVTPPGIEKYPYQVPSLLAYIVGIALAIWGFAVVGNKA
ncbi:MAG TPA: hypothetical protein VEA59_06295 [Patescibacteria group bacterium]|nr:hypothetical protein [Patescibacteria group bacterium]